MADIMPTPTATAVGDRRVESGLAQGILTVLLAEIVVLAVTGVYLYFHYLPGADGLRHVARVVHRVTASAAVATSLIAAVVVVSRRTWRGALHVLVALAVPAFAVGASVSGYALPWDQLGLWAVTVGRGIDGYDVLGGDGVRFVIVGGSSVSTGSLRGLLAVHAVVFGLGLAALAVVALRSVRHDRARR